MRNGSYPIVTLVLGLAIGAACGFFIGATGSGQVSAAPPEIIYHAGDQTEGPSAAANNERDVALVQPAALTAAAGNAGEWDPEGQKRDIEAKALGLSQSVAARVEAEVQAAVDPSWTGVITGEIVDDFGQPLAGATVITKGLQSRADGRVSATTTEKVGRAYPGRPSLEESLLETAKRLEKSRLTLPQTTTDDLGRFTLSGLEPGTHSIAAFAEGFVVQGQRALTGTATQLIASQVGAFQLNVQLPDGTEPEEALIFEIDVDGREQARGKWTPASPQVRLSKTRSNVVVMSGSVRSLDYRKHAASFVSDPTVLDAIEQGETTRTIELREMTQLRITVKDESSALHHVDPWVKIVSANDDGSAAPTKLRRRQSGPFIATELQPGSYEVQVGRGTETAEARVEVEVAPGLNETEVVLGDIDSSSFIVITCRDQAGQPIRDVEFQYRTSTNGGNGGRSGGLSQMGEHPGGEYWAGWSRVLGDNGTRDGSQVTITAKTGSFGSQAKDIGEDGRVDFIFTEPCELIVEVMNAPSGKVQVNAIQLHDDQKLSEHEIRYSGNHRGSGVAEVDGAGRAVIGKLQPGRYRVIAQLKTSEWELSAPIAEHEISLDAGESVVRLACAELHELVVVAPNLKAGANMNLQKVSLDTEAGMTHVGHQTLGADGRTVFAGLAPGTYMLMAWDADGGAEQMEIEVPCGEVTFAAMEVNGYTITSVKPDKAGHRAGLRVGDTLIGAGEHRVDGDSMFFNRLWIEMAEGPTDLLLLRNGREVTVEIEKLGNGNNAYSQVGVGWHPTSSAR